MANLLQDRNWVAMGLMFVLVAGVSAPLAQARNDGTCDKNCHYKVLHGFEGPPNDGTYPYAGVVLDAYDNLYGTTTSGGSGTCKGGCGTIFEISNTGVETVLYNFAGGTDGSGPFGELIADSSGKLFGTTSGGGTYGYGTVFKLDTSGVETVLFSFAGSPDGASPIAGLILDPAGDLFGTTSGGGTYGYGTVFKLDTSGVETVLYSFAGSPDGASPYASLILDAAGDLFGTTSSGGTYDFGTVFRLDTIGVETVLYSFAGSPDGASPYASLIFDAKGNLYSTTFGGGERGYGTVFKLGTTGKETVLHDFPQSGKGDGENPYAPLVLDRAGSLYGTASAGGGWGDGVIFKIDTAGKETVLYHFYRAHGTGLFGAKPVAGLTWGAKGDLYGTTLWGEHNPCGGRQTVGCGVVFKFTP